MQLLHFIFNVSYILRIRLVKAYSYLNWFFARTFEE